MEKGLDGLYTDPWHPNWLLDVRTNIKNIKMKIIAYVTIETGDFLPVVSCASGFTVALDVMSTTMALAIRFLSGIWSTVHLPLEKWTGASMWVPPCSDASKSLDSYLFMKLKTNIISYIMKIRSYIATMNLKHIGSFYFTSHKQSFKGALSQTSLFSGIVLTKVCKISYETVINIPMNWYLYKKKFIHNWISISDMENFAVCLQIDRNAMNGVCQWDQLTWNQTIAENNRRVKQTMLYFYK